MNMNQHKLTIEIDLQEIGNISFDPIHLQDELNNLFRQLDDGRYPFVVEELHVAIQNCVVPPWKSTSKGVYVDADYLTRRTVNRREPD